MLDFKVLDLVRVSLVGVSSPLPFNIKLASICSVVKSPSSTSDAITGSEPYPYQPYQPGNHRCITLCPSLTATPPAGCSTDIGLFRAACKKISIQNFTQN